MAEKRMFSKNIINTDDFLDLPATTKVLYLYLIGEADDDGFVDKAKGIMRLVGATTDDMKLLLTKEYLYSFDSGVVVIAHWKIHNSVRKDIYKPTKYLAERERLVLESDIYRLRNEAVTDTLQNCNEAETDTNENVPLDKIKIRLSKDNINTTTPPPINISPACARARAREADHPPGGGGVVDDDFEVVRKVYEDNINPISGQIEIQKLADDIERYGRTAVIKAIETAVSNNRRKLSYIEGVLKRWEVNGYDDSGGGGDGDDCDFSRFKRATERAEASERPWEV